MPKQENISTALSSQDRLQSKIRSLERRNLRITKTVLEIATNLIGDKQREDILGHMVTTAPYNLSQQLEQTERQLKREQRSQGTFSDEEWHKYKFTRTMSHMLPQDCSSLILASYEKDDCPIRIGDMKGSITETTFLEYMHLRHPGLLETLRSFTPAEQAGILAQNCLYYGSMGGGKLRIAIQPDQFELLNYAVKLIAEVHSSVDNPKQ